MKQRNTHGSKLPHAHAAEPPVDDKPEHEQLAPHASSAIVRPGRHAAYNVRTTVSRTGEVGERERERKEREREEREREGELLRQTGTLRLLQVYPERLRSSKAGSINTLLKSGPFIIIGIPRVA